MANTWQIAWAKRITPAPLRPFLPYVSPSALSVIHTEAVLALSLRISRDFLRPVEGSEGFAKLRESVEASSLAGKLVIVEKIAQPVALETLSTADRKTFGEAVLALYFHMLHHSSRLFLDLRAENFSYSGGASPVEYAPTRLSFTMTDAFSARVRDLYRGFYTDDVAATTRGLELYAWESKPTPGFTDRMMELLREHFGAAATEPMIFSIEHFQSTFHQIFEEAKRSRAKFHPELAFLGLALITLYLCLDRVREPLDVRGAYFKGAA